MTLRGVSVGEMTLRGVTLECQSLNFHCSTFRRDLYLTYVMPSFQELLFRLKGDVDNRGVIFYFSHGQPINNLCIEMGIHKPTLILINIELGIHKYTHISAVIDSILCWVFVNPLTDL
jgi:hypothetical protein